MNRPPPLMKMRTRAELYRDCLYSSESIEPPRSAIASPSPKTPSSHLSTFDNNTPCSSTNASHSDIYSSDSLSPLSPVIRQPVFTMSQGDAKGVELGSNKSDISGYETDDNKNCLRKCINCDEEKYYSNNGSQQCFWCAHCEGYVLDNCIIAHLVGKQTRLHTLTDDKGHFPQMCWQHKDLIAFYCDDCEVSCCTHCVLSHCTHMFKPIGVRRSELRQQVEGLQNIRIARERQLLVQKQQFTAFQSKCQESKVNFREAIKTRYEKFRKALQEMEEKALQDVDNIESNFEEVNQSFENAQKQSSKLRSDIDLARQAPHPQLQSLSDRHAQLYEAETQLLVATMFDMPQLNDLGCSDGNEEDAINKFKEAVYDCTFYMTHPTIQHEFTAIPATEHPSHLTNAQTPPIRELALDKHNHNIYIARKGERIVQQYSLQGDLQASITLHTQPWRIEVIDDVLFYTTDPLDGIFSVPLSQSDPQVKKLCSMKCCAFAVMNEQQLVLNRDSRQELIIFNYKHKQVLTKTNHKLQDIHYLAYDNTSGNIAVSNACDAIVVMYTRDLEMLLAIDCHSHGLKWPIGLAFHPTNRTLLIADSDNHQLTAIESSGKVHQTISDQQGVAFATYITRQLFVTASFFNQRIKFVLLPK